MLQIIFGAICFVLGLFVNLIIQVAPEDAVSNTYKWIKSFGFNPPKWLEPSNTDKIMRFIAWSFIIGGIIWCAASWCIQNKKQEATATLLATDLSTQIKATHVIDEAKKNSEEYRQVANEILRRQRGGDSRPILFMQQLDMGPALYVDVVGKDSLPISEYGIWLTSGTIEATYFHKETGDPIVVIKEAPPRVSIVGEKNIGNISAGAGKYAIGYKPISDSILFLGQFSFGDGGSGSCELVLEKNGEEYKSNQECGGMLRGKKIKWLGP